MVSILNCKGHALLRDTYILCVPEFFLKSFHIFIFVGDSDLQSILGGMSQQQLMQLLGKYI